VAATVAGGTAPPLVIPIVTISRLFRYAVAGWTGSPPAQGIINDQCAII